MLEGKTRILIRSSHRDHRAALLDLASRGGVLLNADRASNNAYYRSYRWQLSAPLHGRLSTARVIEDLARLDEILGPRRLPARVDSTYRLPVYYDEDREVITFDREAIQALSRHTMALDVDLYYLSPGPFDHENYDPDAEDPYEPGEFRARLLAHSPVLHELAVIERSEGFLEEPAFRMVSRLLRRAYPAQRSTSSATANELEVEIESFFGWGRPYWYFAASTIRRIAALDASLTLITNR